MTTEDDLPEIPVICEECDTRTRIAFEEVEESVRSHNEQFHDGESVAQVDPEVLDHLVDRLADDLGLLD
ncbi:hypothetical protein [Haloarcula montana]|jgi:hypothetical protein|uniref:hypothetical protein n=1 Tax=Haloarcula montana TaxID=3111776 RepID=UPI002D78FF00|nr:hypothetical protein [Haloarcula sp. GH36]